MAPRHRRNPHSVESFRDALIEALAPRKLKPIFLHSGPGQDDQVRFRHDETDALSRVSVQISPLEAGFQKATVRVDDHEVIDLTDDGWRHVVTRLPIVVGEKIATIDKAVEAVVTAHRVSDYAIDPYNDGTTGRKPTILRNPLSLATFEAISEIDGAEISPKLTGNREGFDVTIGDRQLELAVMHGSVKVFEGDRETTFRSLPDKTVTFRREIARAIAGPAPRGPSPR
jgi:hypothetical protein